MVHARSSSHVWLMLFLAMKTHGLASGDNVTLNKNAVRKSDLQIFIDTGTITNQVVLKKPDGSVEGKCLAPLSGKSGNCSANFAQSGTRTTVTLSSVSRANHQGVWTSEHGRDKGNINITVLTIPTLTVSQTVSALTLSGSNTQSLTITAICVYPAVSLDVYFVPTGGGTAVSSPSSTAACTSTGNTGCADTDANGYNCVIVPKLETSLSAGTYHVQFFINLAGQYEPIGLNATITDTVITVEAGSTIVLAVIGLVVAVVCVALCWIMFFKRSGRLQGPCPAFIKSKLSVKQTFIAAVIVTLLVIGIILCIIALVNKGLAYAGAGFALAVVALVLLLVCCRVNAKKNFGQTIITPVYVQSNTTITLTHPADDQATTLTWTGPGGIPYVTGTTVEAGLDDSLKSRVSVSHMGGSYTLIFTEFRPSDMGIYTSKVNGTVDSQMVILEGQTIITPVYVQSNTTLTLTRPADDQATTLTWTGPGGIPYVTGTTVEAGLDDSLKSRVSASHTGGSYTLMFTEFRSSDMGIYTSEVDGIVDTQIVIVQDESTRLQEIIQQVNVCAFALVSTNKRKQKKSN